MLVRMVFAARRRALSVASAPSVKPSFSARADRSHRAPTIETRSLRVEASRDNRRTPGPDRARSRRTHRSDTLVLRSDVQPGRRARRLYAATSCAACRHQHAARAARAPGRAGEDTEKRTTGGSSCAPSPVRTMAGSGTMSWSRAVQRIAGKEQAIRAGRCRGVLDWSTVTLQPVRRGDQGHDHPLCVRSRCLPLFLVDDAHPIEAGRLPNGRSRSLFPRLLLLEQRGGLQDARHGDLLSSRRLPRIASIWGAEGLRGDHRSATSQIRRPPLRASRPRRLLNVSPTRRPRHCVSGIKAARERIVARSDDDRDELLAQARLLARPRPSKIIATVLDEEGPAAGIASSISCRDHGASPRDKPHQDARLELEGKAEETP